jgi:hypothetical protein
LARTNWRKYGVTPLPETGKARRFRDIETGETLSRRQVENRRVIDESGWDSWSQWQRTTSPTARETTESRRWQAFADSAVREGDYDNRAQVRKANSDFNTAWNDWRKTGYERGPRGEKEYASDKRNRPGGPYAKALEASGKRTPGAGYAVGGSPKRGKR